MLEKDILLIINPKASKGRGERKAREIKASFLEHGRQCTVAYTRGIGHAENLARRGVAYDYKVIIAAGGDGTVNEVVNGIMGSGTPDKVSMGIIPIGRGNDFAWCAGIPGKIDDAVSLILSGSEVRIDVGICKGTEHPEGRYFVNGVGFGVEPMVNFRAMDYKHLNGMISYAAAFLYILGHIPEPYHVELVRDGDKEILDTQQISVCNGRRMGSAFIMAPKAVINDGCLDLMYTRHPITNKRTLIRMVMAFFRGSQCKDSDDFSYHRVSHLEISSSSPVMQVHYDGELFTKEGNAFSIDVIPSSLRLLVREKSIRR